MFISSNALAGVIGGLISYSMRKRETKSFINNIVGVNRGLDGVLGLHWWQYLFLIEGASTVVSTKYYLALPCYTFNLSRYVELRYFLYFQIAQQVRLGFLNLSENF